MFGDRNLERVAQRAVIGCGLFVVLIFALGLGLGWLIWGLLLH